MGNIPNTTTNGLVLTSVGNGSNDSQWAINTSAVSVTLAGDVTGASSSNTVVKINGTALGTLTGATNGYVLTWNSSSSTWVAAASGSTLGGYAVNVSALNPTTDTGAMLTFNYNSFTGLSQWVETYVPTGTGSVFFWNGTNWESTSTTGIATGNILVWNNSTSKWVPGGITSGDLSGTYPNPTVAKINGTSLGTLTTAINGNALIWNTPLNSWVPADPTFGGYVVNMASLNPTTDNGSIPYFSNVATNQFLPGPKPSITGDYYSWNTSPSGHWEILTANPGGALSNRGWSSNSIIPSSGTIPITTPGKMVEVISVTGFASYLIGFNITAKNNDATTGRNINAFIYQSSPSVTSLAQSQQFMVNNQIGSTSVSYLFSGSSGSTYSFAGYAYVGGTTTGTANFATITVLGIA